MIPIRATIDHDTRFRRVKDLEHGTLCRALSLDECSVRFDLPRTARGPGSVKFVSGYILRGDRPIGTIHVAREGETFRDLDPTNKADRLTLEQTR